MKHVQNINVYRRWMGRSKLNKNQQQQQQEENKVKQKPIENQQTIFTHSKECPHSNTT